MNQPEAGSWTMVGRALRRRCPLCGGGRMFDKWLKMRDYCEECGFRFDRNEPDYFIGAYTINLIVSELIVVGLMVTVMLVTWPDVPWTLMTWSIVALMIPAPVVLYPYSKSTWLALDLMFQPPVSSEYRDGAAAGSVRSGA